MASRRLFHSGIFLRSRCAFTLVELLVVIAIIGVLTGMLLAAVQKVRESANCIVCMNNEKQLILAVHLYADSLNGQLPPANYYAVVNPQTGNAAVGSAFFALLPYIEQDNLFQTYNQDRPDAGYLGAQYVPLKVHVCPSDPTTNAGISTVDGKSATGNYALNLALFGANGTYALMGQPSPYLLGTIPDGASNTIGLVEAGACFPFSGTSDTSTLWAAPVTNVVNPYYPNPGATGPYPLPQFNVTPSTANPNLTQTYHTAMNVALMDGSVRRITASLSQTTWTNALNPADGQTLGPDW
jgi:prepilin-type N-terminal cleavage/methylation domain-containing protein